MPKEGIISPKIDLEIVDESGVGFSVSEKAFDVLRMDEDFSAGGLFEVVSFSSLACFLSDRMLLGSI